MADDAVHRPIHHSPLGPLALEGGRWGLRSVRFDGEAARGDTGDTGALAEAVGAPTRCAPSRARWRAPRSPS